MCTIYHTVGKLGETAENNYILILVNYKFGNLVNWYNHDIIIVTCLRVQRPSRRDELSHVSGMGSADHSFFEYLYSNMIRYHFTCLHVCVGGSLGPANYP